MIARYALSIAIGIVVTLGVLFTMQTLIATAKQELDDSGIRHFVDFVRVEREETFERKERKREKPEKPDETPPDAPQPRTDSVEPLTAALNIAPVNVSVDVEIGGLGLEASDGEYLPIVKIAPIYPWKAQTQGIQGYCIVEYTVTTSGAVRDAVVVESQPPNIFDRTSIEAALKFKYKPRVVNGEAIEVRGVRNLFRYTLDG